MDSERPADERYLRFLCKPIERQFGKPLAIWSVRNPQSIRESLNGDGWTGAPWERRLQRAQATYETYDGPKLIIDHDRLTEAMKLFDPRRAGERP